jgi:alpha-L-fucosidase
MVMEVVEKYEPDMIWFDFELYHVIQPEYQKRMFADYYNWAVAKGKESAVAHKFRQIHEHTGILDFERGREDKLVPYPWLTDTSLGPWFNSKAELYRSPENLIHVFADIVSKNGCMLLNVGPNADGSIPDRAEKLLSELGGWLQVNGEAIYGTRPWKVYGEGPTKSKGGGFSENKDPDFHADDIRFTTKSDTLYAVSLGLPDKDLMLRSLGKSAGSVRSVEVLGAGAAQWSQDDDGLTLKPMAKWPCKHAVIFKITFAK